VKDWEYCFLTVPRDARDRAERASFFLPDGRTSGKIVMQYNHLWKKTTNVHERVDSNSQICARHFTMGPRGRINGCSAIEAGVSARLRMILEVLR
jgi:hypothetical protein